MEEKETEKKQDEELEEQPKLFSSKVSIVGIFTVLSLILTIPLVVLLSQDKQEIRSRAVQEQQTPTPFAPTSRRSVTISGYVYNDDNRNGIRDEEEAPIKDVMIKMTLSTAGNSASNKIETNEAQTLTNEYGYFKFSYTNLLADSSTYIVTLVVPDGYKTINTNPVYLTKLHHDAQEVVMFGIFPLEEVEEEIPSYRSANPTNALNKNCKPRPACLDATPKCLVPEPKEGWCPTAKYKNNAVARPSVVIPTRKNLPQTTATP